MKGQSASQQAHWSSFNWLTASHLGMIFLSSPRAIIHEINSKGALCVCSLRAPGSKYDIGER